MPFWSSQRIELEQKKHRLVDPFEPPDYKNPHRRLKHGSYELSLSREVLTTPSPNNTEAARGVGQGPTFVIPSGQFALLYTEERLHIPDNVLAFISIKAKIKLKGLVNVSGFHVDPGFSGRLQFSVYNAGNEDVFLEFGKPCFLLWFAELDKVTTDPYDGEHKDQNGITPEDRSRMSHSTHSPNALHQRLERLEGVVGQIKVVGLLIVLPVLIGLFLAIFQHWFESKDTGKANSQGQTSVSMPKLPHPASNESQPSSTKGMQPTVPSPSPTNQSVVPESSTNPL